MADVTIAGIRENGLLGQSIIAGDPGVSIEDCEETLRYLGYTEFRFFESFEDYQEAKRGEFQRAKVFLNPQGSFERIYYNENIPEESDSDAWSEEFDDYEEFIEYRDMESYDRVLRKAETEEGRECLRNHGWRFRNGGHYPF